jgi:hypothetical protein
MIAQNVRPSAKTGIMPLVGHMYLKVAAFHMARVED